MQLKTYCYIVLNILNSMAELLELNFDSELASSVYKLRGIMAEHGKTVVYKTLSVVDQLPHKIYMVHAVCEKNVSYGSGLSVYEAQNDAATKLLNDLELTSTNPKCVNCNVQLSRYINYVGSLQELCQGRAWDLPEYEFNQDTMNVSNNQKHFYTVKCSAGPYESEGVGKTKKMAKKQAAKKLLKHWIRVL